MTKWGYEILPVETKLKYNEWLFSIAYTLLDGW
jgi:hypothetical protein